MSDKKNSDDRVQEARDTARKIWLAGIGAYGRAFSEAQDAIKGMSKDTSRVFDDLVQKGETLEATVQEKSKEFVQKTRASTDDISETIDDRIKDMRARLARGAPKTGEPVDVESRLSAIEAKLDKIMAHLEPKKPTTRKTATRKTTAKTKTKRKPAAKKPAARKSTAKKPAAKK